MKSEMDMAEMSQLYGGGVGKCMFHLDKAGASGV